MLTEQSIRLPSGATLRYVEQGPSDATPLILLHGFPDSWLSYETVLANRAEHDPCDRAVAARFRQLR